MTKKNQNDTSLGRGGHCDLKVTDLGCKQLPSGYWKRRSASSESEGIERAAAALLALLGVPHTSEESALRVEVMAAACGLREGR